MNVDEHREASFSAFESNRRGSVGPRAYGVPLHGSGAIRRDGAYVACSISLEGEAPLMYDLAKTDLNSKLHAVPRDTAL